MTKCHFTTQYYDFEKQRCVPYKCDDEEFQGCGLCIFHSESYLDNKNDDKKRQREILDELTCKARESANQKKPLLFVGYHIPDISIKSIKGTYSNAVYFTKCEFHGQADFSDVEFERGVSFSESKFRGKAKFVGTSFKGKKAKKIELPKA